MIPIKDSYKRLRTWGTKKYDDLALFDINIEVSDVLWPMEWICRITKCLLCLGEYSFSFDTFSMNWEWHKGDEETYCHLVLEGHYLKLIRLIVLEAGAEIPTHGLATTLIRRSLFWALCYSRLHLFVHC